ncbi:Uncharacterized protein QTN25_006434 [Entamoeba marina]
MTSYTIWVDDEATPLSSDLSPPSYCYRNFQKFDDFQAVWKLCMSEFDLEVTSYVNVHIFKSTVKPENTDQSNYSGGRCTYTGDREYILEFIESVIKEVFFENEQFKTYVNGITMCLKDDQKSTFGIWTNTTDQLITDVCVDYLRKISQSFVDFSPFADIENKRPSFFSMMVDDDENVSEDDEELYNCTTQPKPQLQDDDGFSELLEMADPDDFLQQYIEAELDALSTGWGDLYESNKMLLFSPMAVLDVKVKSYQKLTHYTGAMADCGKRKKRGEKKVNVVRVYKKIKDSFTSSDSFYTDSSETFFSGRNSPDSSTDIITFPLPVQSHGSPFTCDDDDTNSESSHQLAPIQSNDKEVKTDNLSDKGVVAEQTLSTPQKSVSGSEEITGSSTEGGTPKRKYKVDAKPFVPRKSTKNLANNKPSDEPKQMETTTKSTPEVHKPIHKSVDIIEEQPEVEIEPKNQKNISKHSSKKQKQHKSKPVVELEVEDITPTIIETPIRPQPNKKKNKNKKKIGGELRGIPPPSGSPSPQKYKQMRTVATSKTNRRNIDLKKRKRVCRQWKIITNIDRTITLSAKSTKPWHVRFVNKWKENGDEFIYAVKYHKQIVFIIFAVMALTALMLSFLLYVSNIEEDD